MPFRNTLVWVRGMAERAQKLKNPPEKFAKS